MHGLLRMRPDPGRPASIVSFRPSILGTEKPDRNAVGCYEGSSDQEPDSRLRMRCEGWRLILATSLKEPHYEKG